MPNKDEIELDVAILIKRPNKTRARHITINEEDFNTEPFGKVVQCLIEKYLQRYIDEGEKPDTIRIEVRPKKKSNNKNRVPYREVLKELGYEIGE